MKCPKCQAENESAAHFCHICGAELEPAKQVSWLHNKTYLLLTIIVGVFSFLGLGALPDSEDWESTFSLFIGFSGYILIIAMMILFSTKKISLTIFNIYTIQSMILSICAFMCYDFNKEDFYFIMYPFVAITYITCTLIYYYKYSKTDKIC